MVVIVPRPARRRRRRAQAAAQRVVNLPNDINAPTAQISYYKLFLEFMNYKDGNAYEYGRFFSECVFLVLSLLFVLVLITSKTNITQPKQLFVQCQNCCHYTNSCLQMDVLQGIQK